MAPTDYLAGKTAVVTGISKGIGRSVTLALRTRGVRVIGWGLTPPDFGGVEFEQCDVSDPTQVEAAARATLSRHPEVDLLVNNAGFGYFSPIETFDIGQFQRMMAVNVQGAFLVTQALVAGMKARGSGHIVNISSIAGRTGAPQGEGYNASKFALAGMSDCLFQELRKDGIKVTTVYPGSTATHFFDEIAGVEANDKMLDPDEVAAAIVHLLDTSPNFLVREIELRPLRSR